MRRLVLCLFCLLLLWSRAAAADTLRRPADAEPETLDPQKTGSDGALAIGRDLFVGLVTLDRALRPVPAAASSWEVSADGLVWTFHLRPDLAWTNGEPVTADDFVYAFRRLVDPRTAAAEPQKLAQLAHARDIVSGKEPDLTTLGVAAPDPRTLRLTLVEPRADFLLLMTDDEFFPLYRKCLEQWGNAWTQPGHIVSDGAFQMTSWTPHSEIVLDKNPRYFDAADVAPDAVHWRITTDMQAALRSFRAGELDLVRLTRETLPWAKANDPSGLVVTPVNGGTILDINMAKGALSRDVRLRQALNLAIDREIIVGKIDPRGETASYGVVSPTVTDHTPQSMSFKDKPMSERIGEAKALMQQAGFTLDHPLKLTVSYSTSEAQKQVLTAIRQMVLPIGAELTLDNMEWQAFVAKMNSRDFDLAYVGTQASYDDPEQQLENYWSGAGIVNLSGYANPKFDALYHAALVDMDTSRRKAELEQAERLVLDDYAVIPLENSAEAFLVSSRLRGFVGNRRFPRSALFSFGSDSR